MLVLHFETIIASIMLKYDCATNTILVYFRRELRTGGWIPFYEGDAPSSVHSGCTLQNFIFHPCLFSLLIASLQSKQIVAMSTIKSQLPPACCSRACAAARPVHASRSVIFHIDCTHINMPRNFATISSFEFVMAQVRAHHDEHRHTCAISPVCG